MFNDDEYKLKVTVTNVQDFLIELPNFGKTFSSVVFEAFSGYFSF
jgi:hypothetical protein